MQQVEVVEGVGGHVSTIVRKENNEKLKRNQGVTFAPLEWEGAGWVGNSERK